MSCIVFPLTNASAQPASSHLVKGADSLLRTTWDGVNTKYLKSKQGFAGKYSIMKSLRTLHDSGINNKWSNFFDGCTDSVPGFKNIDFGSLDTLRKLWNDVKRDLTLSAMKLQKKDLYAPFKHGLVAKKVPFARLTAANLVNIISIVPYQLWDSTIVFAQNEFRSNFGFEVMGKYGFAGYVSYRKKIEGPLEDFFDFNISYTGRVMRIDRTGKEMKDLEKSILQRGMMLDSALEMLENKEDILQRWIDKSHLNERVFTAREKIANYQLDTTSPYYDREQIQAAKDLVELASVIDSAIGKLTTTKDSIAHLKQQYSGYYKSITDGNFSKPLMDNVAGNGLHQQVPDDGQKAFGKAKRSISLLNVGRVYPYQSELTLKNTSLKGIDIAAQYGKWVLGLSAGIIDFRLNTLIQHRKLDMPMPYTAVAKVGYRLTPSMTTTLRYFNGRLDNYTGQINKPKTEGLSLAFEYASKNIFGGLEVAKNISSPSVWDSAMPKNLHIGDMNNMAISVSGGCYIPFSKTQIRGTATAQGKYYSAFNTLSRNTQIVTYDLKFDQSLFRGAIKLSGWVRNSEYTPYLNGIVLQNTVSLKTVNASFLKTGYPSLTISYNPIKQLFLQDSNMRVSIYQALVMYAGYPYQIGNRKATTTITVSQFAGREKADSFSMASNPGTFNMNVVQTISFDGFTSTISVNSNMLGNYRFYNAASDVDINYLRTCIIKTGFSLNKLSYDKSRVGAKLGLQAKLFKRGSIAGMYNLSYLPDLGTNKLRTFNYGNLTIQYNFFQL